MFLVFVGDKPSPKMKPGANPFKGAACERRLGEWIDLVAGSRKIILLNSDSTEDKEQIFYHRSVGNRKFIALGNNASNILKFFDVHHFKLPHPSGRNRQLNNPKFIEAKLEECREWIRSRSKT